MPPRSVRRLVLTACSSHTAHQFGHPGDLATRSRRFLTVARIATHDRKPETSFSLVTPLQTSILLGMVDVAGVDVAVSLDACYDEEQLVKSTFDECR
jgi:hypothetical protein